MTVLSRPSGNSYGRGTGTISHMEKCQTNEVVTKLAKAVAKMILRGKDGQRERWSCTLTIQVGENISHLQAPTQHFVIICFYNRLEVFPVPTELKIVLNG